MLGPYVSLPKALTHLIYGADAVAPYQIFVWTFFFLHLLCLGPPFSAHSINSPPPTKQWIQTRCVIVCMSTTMCGTVVPSSGTAAHRPQLENVQWLPLCAPRRESLWQNGYRTERGPVPSVRYTALVPAFASKGPILATPPPIFSWQRAVMAKGQASAVDMYVHAATVVQH
ncbi:hypothetical protein J3F84DRAFT_356022 [Trichoderma pleuroticola]